MPRTVASESSSTPTLLPTPDAVEGGGCGGSQHPDKRAEHDRTINLADVVEHTLPTPMSGGNGKSERSMQRSKGDRRTGGGHSSIPGLDEIASLLNGERPEHLPPDEELGAGTRELVAALFPTPKIKDRASRGPGATGGPDLGESIALLSSPSTSEGTGVGTGRRMASTLRGQVDMQLMPTPKADDGRAGSPNNKGSAGDLTLPSAALSLLPTPGARDYKDASASPATLNRHSPPIIALLPSPDASMATGGRTRSPEALARGDHQVNLSDVPRLVPTPSTAGGGERTRSGDRSDELLLAGVAQEHQNSWGPYEPAIRRWECMLGRVAPWATEPSPRSKKGRLSPRFVEWMQGWAEGWVTSIPNLSRNQQLKILGNGVVPQQAAEAVRFLLAPVPVREAPKARRKKGPKRATARAMLVASRKEAS